MMTYTQCGMELEIWLSICKSAGCNTYVELGTDVGMSAKRAAEMLPTGSRVVTIDVKNEEVSTNIGTDKVLTFLNASSQEQSTVDKVLNMAQFKDGIDALLIDADHTYEGAKRDWELWSPHVKKLIAQHDIREFGSKQLWEELAPKYESYEITTRGNAALSNWQGRCGLVNAGIGVIFVDKDQFMEEVGAQTKHV